jgi:transcriptional regulator with XRE-family HTH domain
MVKVATHPETPASRAVRAELKKRGWSLNRLGREIEVAQGLVSRWLSGKQKPNRASALRLQEVLGLDPGIWDKEAAPAKPPRKKAA